MIAVLYAAAAMVFVVAVGVAVAFAAHEITSRRAPRVDHEFDLEDEL